MEDGIAYCPVCGRDIDTRVIEGRDRYYCPQCDRVQYKNPKPCAGTLVVDGDSVLLIKRMNRPREGTWSLPAGFLEHDESPQAAAVRELREETSLRLPTAALDLFQTAFVRHPHGQHVLVVVYVAAADQTIGDGVPEPGDDADDARFWSRADLRSDRNLLDPDYDGVFEQAIRTVDG